MKRPGIFVIGVTLAAILTTSTAVFALQSGTPAPNTDAKHSTRSFANVDPQQRLEKEKTNIQQRLTDGKITKENADAAIAKIDQQIKDLQAFNALTLQEKKDKLLNDFTTSTNKAVTDGKLTQDKATTAIANYKAKLDKWDGTGNAFFGGKGLMGPMGAMGEKGEFSRRGPMAGKGFGGFANVDPQQMLEKEKANIQQSLTNGKITKENADAAIAKIDQQIKDLQAFNALTLQEKKDKLLNDFTTSTNKAVTDGKLTQDKATTAIADYKAKLDKWDGTGNAFFGGKGLMGPMGAMGQRGGKGPMGAKGQIAPKGGKGFGGRSRGQGGQMAPGDFKIIPDKASATTPQ